MKQGKRAANVIESRIQIFDCKVFSNVVFAINSFNEVLSFRDCWFCYMSKFDSFSDDCLNSLLFKTEHTIQMRVLKHKIDVSLFIDLVALYINP